LAATLYLLAATAAAGESPVISPQLHERAVAVLRDATARGQEWVKVHAAESLLWTGHPENVYETFLQERDGAAPKYRIGVWRVLAQAAPSEEERRSYRGRILEAFLDLNGPDRGHAAETLGKLGYAGHEPEFARVGEQETGSFQACARWVVANSGGEKDEASLAALLDSENADARGCAAYAFRFFRRIRPATYTKLRDAAEREPKDSPWRVNLLSTVYVHADEDVRPAIKNSLATYAETGTKEDKREVCAALGRHPDPADVALLTRLLADPELDVRAAAAEGLLRIEKPPK
jgi:HEAT repeat protein